MAYTHLALCIVLPPALTSIAALFEAAHPPPCPPPFALPCRGVFSHLALHSVVDHGCAALLLMHSCFNTVMFNVATAAIRLPKFGKYFPTGNFFDLTESLCNITIKMQGCPNAMLL